MALPKIDIPTFTTTLPASKKEVKYRPFLVGEEKIMIIANSSGEDADMETAIEQVVSNCTFGEIDLNELAQVDLEWLLVQIHARAKGFITQIAFKCLAENADGKECGHVNEIDADLNKIEVVGNTDNLIDLGTGIGLKMRTPSIGITNAIEKLDEDEVENTFTKIISCIESIYDEENVWLTDELEKEEIMEFINQFSDAQFLKVKDWVDNIQTLKLEVNFLCMNCGKKDKVVIEGIESFFG